jgi:hypothetical protein
MNRLYCPCPPWLSGQLPTALLPYCLLPTANRHCLLPTELSRGSVPRTLTSR